MVYFTQIHRALSASVPLALSSRKGAAGRRRGSNLAFHAACPQYYISQRNAAAVETK
jgi:hypothetical protein